MWRWYNGRCIKNNRQFQKMANKIKINRIKSGRIAGRNEIANRRSGKRHVPLATRRRKRRLVIVLLSFVLIIAAGFGLSKLSFSPSVSLSAVHIRGASIISEADIKKIVEDQITSPVLGLFSRNNLLLASREKIAEKITTTFKTIERVDISFDSIHDMVVAVRERVPSGLWCGAAEASASDLSESENVVAKCFYIDKTGYIFAEAPVFSGDVFLTWRGFVEPNDLTDSSSNSSAKSFSPIGRHIMPQVSFEKLNAFVADIGKLDLRTVSIEDVSDSELELYLANGGVIVVNRKMSYDQTLQNLESIVAAKQAEFRGSFIDRVEKIDVRFTGKAFVKLKDGAN